MVNSGLSPESPHPSSARAGCLFLLRSFPPCTVRLERGSRNCVSTAGKNGRCFNGSKSSSLRRTILIVAAAGFLQQPTQGSFSLCVPQRLSSRLSLQLRWQRDDKHMQNLSASMEPGKRPKNTLVQKSNSPTKHAQASGSTPLLL